MPRAIIPDAGLDWTIEQPRTPRRVRGVAAALDVHVQTLREAQARRSPAGSSAR